MAYYDTRCIQWNGNHSPSPWMRMIYKNRDRIENLVRKVHIHSVYEPHHYLAYTVPMLMNISYTELIERAYEDLKDRLAKHFWDDPVI